jgi:peptidoglycan hydrolase-like protein with peptidoglycan-binding domain
MPGKIFLKYGSIYILSVLSIIFLFHGCVFTGFGRHKEAEEEKKIFGFLDGYNYRIKEAQGCLMSAGFNPGLIDGKMRNDTRKAVKCFQRANDLNATGFIGARTWQKMSNYRKDPLKYYSSTPEGVKEFQQALKGRGFDPGPVDGKIGLKTKKAIMAFQSAEGLSVNGTIDTKVLESLGEYFTKRQED